MQVCIWSEEYLVAGNTPAHTTTKDTISITSFPTSLPPSLSPSLPPSSPYLSSSPVAISSRRCSVLLSAALGLALRALLRLYILRE